MIEFNEINNENVYDVCCLKVFDEQKEFVADNAISLAEAFAATNEGNFAMPFAVLNDGTLIGFVMIAYGTVGDKDEPPLAKNNYALWRLMINKKYQGIGLFKEILDKVKDYVLTFPAGKADYLWLSYEPENTRAAKLYRKYGFIENGEYCGEETVAILKL